MRHIYIYIYIYIYIREKIWKNSPKLKKKINKVAGNQILRKLGGKMNELR